MQACEKNYCPRCKSNLNVFDANTPHNHQWSRKTINSMECKIYGIVQSAEDYFKTKGA